MRGFLLRAFLMLRTGDGTWTVTVCRDLSAIMQAWKSRSEPENQVAVLHIGFDRPPSQVFEELATKHKGRILLTEAAKHCLPSSFISSSSPIGNAEDCKVFLGLKGWGYFIDDPIISKQDIQQTGNLVSTSEFMRMACFVCKRKPIC